MWVVPVAVVWMSETAGSVMFARDTDSQLRSGISYRRDAETGG
jgi:hypothetical protein